MSAAETRLRAAIRLAEASDLGGRWPTADDFAKQAGGSLRFKNGTYVLQCCGLRTSSTWKSPDMVWNWLEKARARLEGMTPAITPKRFEE